MRLTGKSNPVETDLEALQEWQAARDLRLGGFDDAADRMLSSLIDTLSTNPWALVEAAELLAAQDEHRASVSAATQVMTLFGLNWTEAHPELLRLAYPRPWAEVMALHTQSEGVDPLLLWSLIRRESLYDADAEGLAGEVGLTQVIPLTGSDIAAGLGIEYAHSDLARPELAIRFGAWYLARQLEGFSNEPIMALAAYNAGPGNAARWEAEAAIAGPDGFLAALDFQSTRMYVQYVIESLAVYKALERADQPQ
ncbi:MAG: lytic transglycosylase domain-containing protein [Chloroflexi bacterium]|nr:lytic transglycosylase domain-containing protein [Chloroflexota bacterium]